MTPSMPALISVLTSSGLPKSPVTVSNSSWPRVTLSPACTAQETMYPLPVTAVGETREMLPRPRLVIRE